MDVWTGRPWPALSPKAFVAAYLAGLRTDERTDDQDGREGRTDERTSTQSKRRAVKTKPTIPEPNLFLCVKTPEPRPETQILSTRKSRPQTPVPNPDPTPQFPKPQTPALTYGRTDSRTKHANGRKAAWTNGV